LSAVPVASTRASGEIASEDTPHSCSSIVRVLVPLSFLISSSAPTAMMRLPRIAIASAAGFFLFRLANLLTGVTTVLNVYQPLTDATTQAMLYRAMVSAKNRVDGLALGVTTSVRWLPRKQMSSEGTIIAITPVNSETFPGIMNATDDIGLPFAVVVMDPSNQDPTLNLNRNLLWRERILSALRYQRLAGVAEGYICNPEPAMIVNPGMFDAENLTFSPLFFRLITRTVRG